MTLIDLCVLHDAVQWMSGAVLCLAALLNEARREGEREGRALLYEAAREEARLSSARSKLGRLG